MTEVLSVEELCCYVDDDGRMCEHRAEVEIIEERTDLQRPLADSDITTFSCLYHTGRMLGSEDGSTLRWTVTFLVVEPYSSPAPPRP